MMTRGFLILVVCFLRACQVARAIELNFDNQLVIVANGKLRGRVSLEARCGN
jgi:hypothetical protein